MALEGVRIRLDETTSTNLEASKLARDGAEHGSVVSAQFQTDGRGRQGRGWIAPKGQALLCSVILRDPPKLLPLAAAVAVANTVGPQARIKWPNDIVFESEGRSGEPSRLRKVAGILIEANPGQGWAVLGVGMNVALDLDQLEPDLAATAATMGLAEEQIDEVLEALLVQLDEALALGPAALRSMWLERDVLVGRPVAWNNLASTEAGGDGRGTVVGISDSGQLLVQVAADAVVALDAADVHLV